MQAATQQLTNNAKLKEVRRGIARVRTLMHQKAKAGRHDRSKQTNSSRSRRRPRRARR